MGDLKELTKRIIVALDVGTKDEALSLVRQLEEAEIFKVGLRLFTAGGPIFLRKIQSLRKKIFLDLKFHDIPNTVAGAVKEGVRLGAHMITLHASGGYEMMAAAADAATTEAERENTTKPLLLAVTVLTSLKGDQLKKIGMESDTFNQVLRLASLAKKANMDGIVCSPQEIEIIRKELGNAHLIVAPGIRPSWAAAQDQKRIMTPSLAFEKGADYLVIGRPIITAISPQKAFHRIKEELDRSVHSSNSSHKENSP